MNLNESNCLSALMKDAEEVYKSIAQGLSEAHFTDPICRILFIAILKASADSKDTSPHSVWKELSTLDGKSPITISQLIEIEGLQPTQAHRAKFVSLVMDAKRKADLSSALADAVEALQTPANSFDELWESVAPHIEAAQNATSVIQTKTFAEMCEQAAIQIERPEMRKTISCGIPAIDQLFTPMREGQVICLAGRPGTGKSALAGQIGLSVARTGARVAYFSLEMSGEELAERMGLVRAGRAAIFDSKNLINSIRELSKLRSLYIFDNSQRHTVAGIAAKCRLLNTQSGGLSLIVIDYLQLITPSDKKIPREQQIAEISRSIKELAGGLKVPILILAQLNRDSEKEERRPRKSDLRESGAIEQDSDRVWLLWHEMKDGNSGTDQIDIMLIQDKCRGGPPNVAKMLRFDGPIYTFTPIHPLETR